MGVAVESWQMRAWLCLVGALGKGLAEGSTRVSLRHRGRPWQDLVDFLGKDLAKDRRLLVPI